MRRGPNAIIGWAWLLLGAAFWLAVVADYAHRRREKVGVTVPAVTPTPIVNIEPTQTLTIPIRPAMGRVGKWTHPVVVYGPLTGGGGGSGTAQPLTFSGPEGVLVIRWGTWFDTVSTDCARAALALVAREGAPGYSQYRDARFGRAYSVCPEFRR